jgi:hypothetical protein
VACYAESKDGIHWIRPKLGLFEFNGSKNNNIVWDGVEGQNFTPFKDANPACKPEQRYKAVGWDPRAGGAYPGGLMAFQSADGIRWTRLQPKPVITQAEFDSQNVAFWDSTRQRYVAFHRNWRNNKRGIMTTTSTDFLHWTNSVWLECRGTAQEYLYTNQITPYYRAPYLFLGFPTRYIDRGWTKATEALPRLEYRRLRGAKSPREGTAITDGMFMSSRDGNHFQLWPESFIRPGLRTTDNWFYGDNYQNWGLVETKSAIADAPKELSIYVTERYAQERGRPVNLRRYALRVDGFVSVNAPLSGGEFITKPIRFQGSRLLLNYSTSAAGSIRIEVQNENGQPIPGFALADAPELYGDSLEQPALWKDGSDMKQLAGKIVRLRFLLKDADVYAIRFR